MPEPGSGTREFIDDFLRGIGMSLESINISMILGSPELIMQMVKSGVGISLVSKMVGISGVERRINLSFYTFPANDCAGNSISSTWERSLRQLQQGLLPNSLKSIAFLRLLAAALCCRSLTRRPLACRASETVIIHGYLSFRKNSRVKFPYGSWIFVI